MRLDIGEQATNGHILSVVRPVGQVHTALFVPDKLPLNIPRLENSEKKLFYLLLK